jgi:hypothetical protein
VITRGHLDLPALEQVEAAAEMIRGVLLAQRHQHLGRAQQEVAEGCAVAVLRQLQKHAVIDPEVVGRRRPSLILDA